MVSRKASPADNVARYFNWSQLSILNEPDTNPFEVSNADVEDASDPRLWIDSDQEGHNDQDVDVFFLIY